MINDYVLASQINYHLKKDVNKIIYVVGDKAVQSFKSNISVQLRNALTSLGTETFSGIYPFQLHDSLTIQHHCIITILFKYRVAKSQVTFYFEISFKMLPDFLTTL